MYYYVIPLVNRNVPRAVEMQQAGLLPGLPSSDSIVQNHALEGALLSRKNIFFKIISAGQNLVTDDWRRLNPTKAAIKRKYGETV